MSDIGNQYSQEELAQEGKKDHLRKSAKNWDLQEEVKEAQNLRSAGGIWERGLRIEICRRHLRNSAWTEICRNKASEKDTQDLRSVGGSSEGRLRTEICRKKAFEKEAQILRSAEGIWEWAPNPEIYREHLRKRPKKLDLQELTNTIIVFTKGLLF